MKDSTLKLTSQMFDFALTYGTRSKTFMDFLRQNDKDQDFMCIAAIMLDVMHSLRPGIKGPKRFWQTWRT